MILKVINKKTVESIVLEELGQDYCAEDKNYQLLPEKFFGKTLKQKVLGLRQWFYISEGFDCDNFADKLRQQIKDRYWSKFIKSINNANGSWAYPDVFVECVKVMYPGARMPHWFVCAICADENGEPKVIFRERTSTKIVTPRPGYKIIRIK